jgi:hypothetical protein
MQQTAKTAKNKKTIVVVYLAIIANPNIAGMKFAFITKALITIGIQFFCLQSSVG